MPDDEAQAPSLDVWFRQQSVSFSDRSTVARHRFSIVIDAGYAKRKRNGYHQDDRRTSSVRTHHLQGFTKKGRDIVDVHYTSPYYVSVSAPLIQIGGPRSILPEELELDIWRRSKASGFEKYYPLWCAPDRTSRKYPREGAYIRNIFSNCEHWRSFFYHNVGIVQEL